MNQSRLVDTNELYKLIEDEFKDVCVYDVESSEAIDHFQRIVDLAHTVDAIKVVRCIDCQHHEEEEPGMIWCPIIKGSWVSEDFFCADGIRREDEETE